MSVLGKLLKVATETFAEREAPRVAERAASKYAVKKVAKKAANPLALPAPEKRLALPAPKPGRLETYADVATSKVKPKGGQWMPDAAITGTNYSPEYATRSLLNRSNVPLDSPLHPWAVKALPKYVKRDMGTVDDPLSALADRGYVPEVAGREGWLQVVNGIIGADPAAEYQGVDQFFGKPVADVARARKHNRFFSGVEETMPWVHKLPATDPVYTLYGDHPLHHDAFTHTLDELQNAMNPTSGLPPHLQIGESTLQRMSWPQAVERSTLIGQWREAQMAAERANMLQSNPAFHKVMDIPDHPQGLAWYQIKPPEELPDGWYAAGSAYHHPEHGVSFHDPRTKLLREALANEGDSMGHCVGGYCGDVTSGHSRIYSLRDAKGEPHVTIETRPQGHRVPSEVADAISRQVQEDHAIQGLVLNPGINDRDFWKAHDDEVDRRIAAWKATAPDDILQIKGKQNRKPKEDYIPAVQQFLKSREWGKIGDLKNADMLRLPDARHITLADLDKITQSPAAIQLMQSAENAKKNLAPWNINTFSDEDWNQTKHLFDGYKRGGFVAKPKASCGCGCNGFAVKGCAK